MAIDSPPRDIIQAAPRTTTSAPMVITSRPPYVARMRNRGFTSQRPAT